MTLMSCVVTIEADSRAEAIDMATDNEAAGDYRLEATSGPPDISEEPLTVQVLKEDWSNDTPARF